MDKILIIDDDESMRDTLKLFLMDSNYELLLAENGSVGIKMLDKFLPDLVITDLVMPKISGYDVLKESKKIDKNINVIVLSAFDDMSRTIKAIQLGAYDYLTKPIEQERLNLIISRALESKKLNERILSTITAQTEEYKRETSLIGHTQGMKEIYKQIGHISVNRVTVLVQGESGTGKELVSKIIHYSGITKDHPFIPLNCSALSESLLESELFGHVKGSFTGAFRDKKGKFEIAGEGTIFLDEISETSLNFQAKLLRVIQEHEIQMVGGEASIPIKARIIASTNRNLQEVMDSGKFREDLFYRLNVFSIKIPPLRERMEDIPHLVVHLLEKINLELHKSVSKVPLDTMEILQNHDWVGNVRELENTLIQAVVLAKGNVLEKEYLLFNNNHHRTNISESKPTYTLVENEKKYILDVLNYVHWDKTKARNILGIAKSTLYKKIEEYNLQKSNN
jgi:two-component system response regulator AtoC